MASNKVTREKTWTLNLPIELSEAEKQLFPQSPQKLPRDYYINREEIKRAFPFNALGTDITFVKAIRLKPNHQKYPNL